MSLWSADGKRQISGFPTGNRPVRNMPSHSQPKAQPFSAWNQTPNPFGQQYGGTFTPGGGAGNMAYAQPNQRPQPFSQNNTFGGRQFGNMGDAFAMRDAFVNQVNRTRNPFAQQWGQGNTTPQAMDFDTLMRQAGDAVQGGWANPFAPGQAQPVPPPGQGTPYGKPVGGTPPFDPDYAKWRGQQFQTAEYRGPEAEAARERDMYQRYLRERGGHLIPSQGAPYGFMPYMPPGGNPLSGDALPYDTRVLRVASKPSNSRRAPQGQYL